MRLFILNLILAAICIYPFSAESQVIGRDRPAEWDDLVYGGRFLDRFLPMPAEGPLTSDTWGADNVKPRYIHNGIEDDEWSYWGGNALVGPNGQYHRFLCRWREDAKKGHHEWHDSIVVHAVADKSTGPYKVIDTVGPGHNPEIFRLKDGRYVIYIIDGYYISNSLDGPWQRKKFEFHKRDREIIEGLSNLSFAQREDGSYLMVCRGGGIWISETGISPYNQVSNKSVYPDVEGRFEDPVVWRTHVQYHLIVNDWLGRIAYHLRSKNGVDWKVDPGQAYEPGISKYDDGTEVDWFKYERMKVLQDDHGRATQADFAVIDVLKDDDKGSDEHSSKHICIPLNVGRILTILDKEPITADTETIRVKIVAEEDFDPHADIDIDSLRFGASEEVNFGRGCKPLETKRSGADLIVNFDGTGNGITEDNFAAKLLGRTSDGKLLFGYARLPGLDYMEPILSACAPELKEKNGKFQITTEVQNFGQVESEPAKLEIQIGKDDGAKQIAEGKIPALEPYGKTKVKLTCGNIFEKGKSYNLRTVINSSARYPAILHSLSTPLQ